MGEIIDFLFKVCCLSGIIFSIVGTPCDLAAKKASSHEIGHFVGLQWYLFLLHRKYQSLQSSRTRRLCLVDRFCILGFFFCMALAVLLILLGIMLRLIFILVPHQFR